MTRRPDALSSRDFVAPAMAASKSPAKNSPELAGVQVVFQTPFREDGSIDIATLERELEWLFDWGADGIVFAMVSEILRMSSEERDQIAIVTSAFARGHGDCVVSVGAESVNTAIRHAKVAETAGASALMAAPPSLFRVGDDALLRYYEAIADAVSIPVVVQDASGYVGAPLSIELQARLFHNLGERVYFKPEAPPIGPRVTQLLAATDGDARVFEGTGGLYLIDSFRRGAIGTMPAGDMVWALVPLWGALQAGNFEYAYRIAGPLTQIVSLQTSLDSFVAIEKRNLVRQGIFPRATMRQPTGEVLDIALIEELDRLFDLLQQAVDHV